MTIASTNLAVDPKVAVMPMVKPTVLKAEKHSKAMGNRPWPCSKDATTDVESPRKIKDSTIAAKALRSVMLLISRPPYSTRLRPLAVAKMFSVAIPNVVVLMPPPVEPGDAPTYISSSVIINVGILKLL